MDKKEQTRFVKQLCNAIRDEILQQIKDGKIPDNWDGIELRWLIAERSNQSAVFGNKSRKREYDNTVIVNNL